MTKYIFYFILFHIFTKLSRIFESISFYIKHIFVPKWGDMARPFSPPPPCDMIYYCSCFLNLISIGIIIQHFLTFMGPCIVIYFYSKTNDMRPFVKFILFCSCTLHVSDGFFRPSSRVYDCTYGIMYMSNG
jgi:hypothetical protein